MPKPQENLKEFTKEERIDPHSMDSYTIVKYNNRHFASLIEFFNKTKSKIEGRNGY